MLSCMSPNTAAGGADCPSGLVTGTPSTRAGIAGPRRVCWTGCLRNCSAQLVRVKSEAMSLDSTSIKVHPDGTSALKNGPRSIGKSRGGWNTKIHRVAANDRTAVTFGLAPGQAHDAPEGRRPPQSLEPVSRPIHLLMDRAYAENKTRQLALDPGLIPVVPPIMRSQIEP